MATLNPVLSSSIVDQKLAGPRPGILRVARVGDEIASLHGFNRAVGKDLSNGVAIVEGHKKLAFDFP
ncbi:MAG: hypothetical protein AAB676_15220 [Verrucomicrobiota bacterium]